MRMLKAFILIWISMFCLFGAADSGSSLRRVSIKKLSDSPNAYQGLIVEVEGTLSMEFEGTFVSSIRCDKVSPVSSEEKLWLVVPKNKLSKANRLNHKNVKITGKFDSKRKGHMGLFFGTLTVDKIEELKSNGNGC